MSFKVAGQFCVKPFQDYDLFTGWSGWLSSSPPMNWDTSYKLKISGIASNSRDESLYIRKFLASIPTVTAAVRRHFIWSFYHLFVLPTNRWGFPKIGVPLNHPLKWGFPYQKPTMFGDPMTMETPQMFSPYLSAPRSWINLGWTRTASPLAATTSLSSPWAWIEIQVREYRSQTQLWNMTHWKKTPSKYGWLGNFSLWKPMIFQMLCGFMLVSQGVSYDL